MLKFEKTNLSFDSDACMNALIKYFIDILHEADEQYLNYMAAELLDAEKRPRDESSRISKWRQQVMHDMEEINIKIAKGKIESKVGIKGGGRDEIWRKGVILQKGGGPDYAGPYGRVVWDDDYAGKRRSRVRVYKEPGRKLSEKWKLAGKDWMDNATKRMETYYKHCIESADSRIPSNFFARFMKSG